MLIVPDELQVERNALIAEIYAAFKGVSRKGGVSWNETKVIDGYGSDEDRRKARATDTDRSWKELATNQKWDVFLGIGGFPFLDPIGFCYYLPAAMIRNILDGEKQDVSFALELNKATKPRGLKLRDNLIHKWSLLDDRQRRCVARFIRFMIAWEEAIMDEEFPGYEAEQWRTAYERYWKQFE